MKPPIKFYDIMTSHYLAHKAETVSTPKVGAVCAQIGERTLIFMHVQSVYNSLPPPAEAKHYTACELSDVEVQDLCIV